MLFAILLACGPVRIKQRKGRPSAPMIRLIIATCATSHKRCMHTLLMGETRYLRYRTCRDKLLAKEWPSKEGKERLAPSFLLNFRDLRMEMDVVN